MNPNGLHRFLARSIFPILLVIIVLALGLRLTGLQWDQGNFFHPDERSIYMRVDCMHRVLTVAPYYQDCIDFYANWDQFSFDPDYDIAPLENFYSAYPNSLFPRATIFCLKAAFAQPFVSGCALGINTPTIYAII